MAAKFYPLIIQEIYKETPDCVIITFDIPDDLKDQFNYTHGQNITIKKTIEGEEIRRCYSICSAPFENKLSVAVKKIATGKFSAYANTHLQKGESIAVMPPEGRFTTPLSGNNKKKYLAFAAGSGITPVISIIKSTLAAEPLSSFTLVYGNRSRSSIIFFEELEGLKNKYVERFNLINILSGERIMAPINFGRINPEKLRQLQKIIDFKNIDEAFICGPQEMLFTVKEFLEGQGLNNKKIHFELFITSGNEKILTKEISHTEVPATTSRVTIQLDGRSFEFDLSFNKESILDAALKQGADLPFACKGGMCCTCRARLTEGEVKMDVNYSLGEEELSNGFILTCQSHPLTLKVAIDFDSR